MQPRRVSTSEVVFKLVDGDTNRCRVLEKIEQRKNGGWDCELAEASLYLFVQEELKTRALPFTVVSYHVSLRGELVPDRRNQVNEAIVKVLVNGGLKQTVAEGDGPIHALDGALRGALEETFPQLKDAKLTDYSVKLLNGAPGTAGKTSVLVETTNGQERWWTLGVDKNVVLASLVALVDSMEYFLMIVSPVQKAS